MSEISTKPYLLRAIYEWCTDNGFTPYLAAKVGPSTRVPMQFVKDGEIVLNISFEATSGLKMDNELIYFNARFGGVSREISVPVANVIAIYARENGQGMAFEASPIPEAQDNAADESDAAPQITPILTSVPQLNTESVEKSSEIDSELPKKGGRPTLTRIK